jgi:hypothetical protein
MIENRALGRIFGPKRNEVIRGWGKLHNEVLLRSAGHVARMGEKRIACRILVGKPECETKTQT